MHESEKWKWSLSVMSNSSWPHGPQPTRLLCPWDFPGKSTGVGCHHLQPRFNSWVRKVCWKRERLPTAVFLGFSGDSAGKESPAMQETWVRSWVGKIPWRRERLPTPVFWAGEFHGLYSPWGYKELDMTDWLSYRWMARNLFSRTINKDHIDF